MKTCYRPVAMLALLCFALASAGVARSRPAEAAAYLGFDRNDYPGDANLPLLRRTFAYTGYWLNNPPEARSNRWRGKRKKVQDAGFGFLLLFNGRMYAELKSGGAAALGTRDGKAAVHSARDEGFPRAAIIFLDQEQGGRMLPEQRKYVFAWAEAVRRGGFRPGIYCSGISVAEADGGQITTAEDLHESPEGRSMVFWIANDACPPSPGCIFPHLPPPPGESGVGFAEVWQFAQSPLRRQFASGCTVTYSKDGNCYPPGAAAMRPRRGDDEGMFLDVNSARSADPSHGRR